MQRSKKRVHESVYAKPLDLKWFNTYIRPAWLASNKTWQLFFTKFLNLPLSKHKNPHGVHTDVVDSDASVVASHSHVALSFF